MKSFFALFSFLLLPYLAQAQKTLPERLKDSLNVARPDSLRYELTSKLAAYYAESSRETCITYIDQDITLAKAAGKTLDLADDLGKKAYALIHLGRFAQAYSVLQEAKLIAEDASNENKFWRFSKNNVTATNRLNTLANIYGYLGYLMGETGSITQEIAEYRQALKLGEQNKLQDVVIDSKMAMGYAYLRQGKLDSSLLLTKEGIKGLEQSTLKDTMSTAASLTMIGMIYAKMNQKALALHCFRKAKTAYLSQHISGGLANVYEELSKFYEQEKQADSSLYYAKKLMSVAKLINSGNAMPFAYERMYKSYKLSHTPDSVIKYMELTLTSRDSSSKTLVKNLADIQQQAFKTQTQLNDFEKQKELNRSRNRAVLLLIAIGVLGMLALIFYRNNRQKLQANLLLMAQKEEIEKQRDASNKIIDQLNTAQTQLIQSEKMASLGELTAGIAHEIQNPLNFVNNFSEVNAELIDEMEQEIKKGDFNQVKALAADIKENQLKISTHGKRADFIIKGMLQHSRTGASEKQETNINMLASEFMKLSYHGLRAKDKNFNAEMVTHFDENLPKLNLTQQDIGRVLLNLFNNAFYAVNQKQKTAGLDYKPTVTVSTSIVKNKLVIAVGDNGNGISDSIKDKIMQPFFTTKPAGEGTGLGLSLSYDIIVKGHGGEIAVETKVGDFTTFTISLPRN